MKRAVLCTTIAALAYFIGARVGYAFAFPQGLVTLWPPSGIMLGILLVSDRRDWLALLAGGFVGSIVSDRMSGYSVGLATAAAFANGSENLLAAWLVTSRVERPITLSSLRNVVELVVGAAIVANFATAWGGALVLHVGFRIPFREAWFIWWVGDGLGMLIVTPVVLAWARIAEGRPAVRIPRVLEALVLLAILVATAEVALGSNHGWGVQLGPYAAFPVLLWAGIRFGPNGAATASLIVAAIATWNAALGAGPFALPGSSALNAAMQNYAFLVVACLSSLIPAAVLEERKRAERRLAESEDRYRTVVNAASDAIVTIDDESRIQFANPAVERVFGYSPGELAGRHLTTLMPDRFHDRHVAAVSRYLGTGAPNIDWRGVGMTGLTKDGREIPLEVSLGELAAGGRHVFTAILRDVSERRAAEQALRAVEDRMRFAMEASRVGVWEADLVTGSERWSEMQEALHGLAPGTFGGTFQAFMERIHPDDRRDVQDEIERAARQHTDSNILYRTTWPDRSVHWVSGTGRTFYDASGAPTRAAGIALDVTERRSLEEQARQSQKMEAIGQLAGGVAHDFNNVLTVIQSYGALMAQDLDPASPSRPDLAEILRAADRAASLTRQLLAFSRRQIVAPRVLNLWESLRVIEPMLRRLIGEDIEVVVKASDDVGQVKADSGQIEQVILNLAINARDAMPDGGVLILELKNVTVDETDVERRTGVKPRDYVAIEVTDSGIGMDAATIARAFEPFFTTKPVGKGTGLGLSTVYGIVQQSGGSVSIQSETGRGTTVRVVLPRVDSPADTLALPDSIVTGDCSETVLVVEDDEYVRRLACRILEGAGYDVLPAATPREALRVAAAYAERIHLLLTDVVMPEMSGRALAEQLRPLRPGMHVLYMSGYTDDAIVLRGALEHGTELIQKPFDRISLLRTVREVLDQPALD